MVDSVKKFSCITLAAAIVCCFLSGCENTDEKIIYINGEQYEDDTSLLVSMESNSTSSSTSTSTNTSSTSTLTNTSSTSTSTSTYSTVSKPFQPIVNTTTESQNTETLTESISQTVSVPAEEIPPDEKLLEWSETEFNGEFYVNTDDVFSRINAIQGSETVARYKLNDKVTVTAKTDTDYYKLPDGTFIHADFLSENEIVHNTESTDGENYVAVSGTGYTIERIDGITYVDGIMIANKTYSLPASYDPGIRQEAAEAFYEMQEAASTEGISLFIVSGYRSYETQESVYAGWVNRDGKALADTYSSRPGYSDHQTGYTFDLNSLEQDFAYTEEGIWLAEHCAEFGFIIRYPEGKEMYTGYVYEPWHVRYIGKEKAKIITESGLSLEEYYGITSIYADSTEV